MPVLPPIVILGAILAERLIGQHQVLPPLLDAVFLAPEFVPVDLVRVPLLAEALVRISDLLRVELAIVFQFEYAVGVPVVSQRLVFLDVVGGQERPVAEQSSDTQSEHEAFLCASFRTPAQF